MVLYIHKPESVTQTILPILDILSPYFILFEEKPVLDTVSVFVDWSYDLNIMSFNDVRFDSGWETKCLRVHKKERTVQYLLVLFLLHSATTKPKS